MPVLAAPLFLAALTLVPSMELARKFLGNAGSAGYAVAMVAVFVAVFAIESHDPLARFVRRHEWVLAGVWVMAMTVALAVVYPLAQARIFGPGSDRDDALIVGIEALLSLRYPYYERTYFGGALSPGPGALLIGTPFHLLGSVVIQNAVFGIIGGFCFARCLDGWRTRWLLVPALTFGNIALVQDYLTGGDFAINAIYVALAVRLTAAEADCKDRRRGRTMLYAALLGVAMCSRPVYGIAGVALTAWLWRRHGAERALEVAAVAFGITAALGLPFYLYDPARFGPFHITGFVPPEFRFLAVLLPILAAAVAALAPLWRAMEAPSLFGVIALSIAIILLPGGLSRMSVGHFGLAYMMVVGLYGALALLSGRYRQFHGGASVGGAV